MGIAPGYMVLMGIVEILCSLFLFNKRTVVIGALIELFILINVVGINIFYNVQVKMFSTQLFIYILFLLSPYAYKLFQFFILGGAVILTAPNYYFLTRWKRYALINILTVGPLLIILPDFLGISERYGRNKKNGLSQRIYDVNSFVAKDTIPPLLTDTLRWKRLLYSYSNYSRKNYAVIFDMKDAKDYYDCHIDSNKNTVTFKDDPDSLKWVVFHFENPAKDKMILSGKWKGQDIRVSMSSIPINSFVMNKEKIRLVRD